MFCGCGRQRSYRKFKDFGTWFLSLNPLVACAYPRPQTLKKIMVCLKLEVDTACWYMSACTHETHSIPANAEPTVLPLAEITFHADEYLDDAIDFTMQWGVDQLLHKNAQRRKEFAGLAVGEVSKVAIERFPRAFSTMYRDMVLVVHDNKEELKHRLPPSNIMTLSELAEK